MNCLYITNTYDCASLMLHSGNGAAYINRVTLHQVQLLLGWVTLSLGRPTTSVCNSHPDPLSLLPSVGWEVSTGQNAVMFCSKCRYGSFHLCRTGWQVSKSVWSFINTCHKKSVVWAHRCGRVWTRCILIKWLLSFAKLQWVAWWHSG